MTISRVTSATSTACAAITPEQAIEEIRSGQHKAAIQSIRDDLDLDCHEAADAAKRKLPAILWNGQFSKRSTAGCTGRSGLIVADLDGLDDPAAVREALRPDDYVFAAFISPSGRGLKVVFNCNTGASHADNFAAMEHHLRTKYALATDPSGKDVSRLCFVSHDPELHHNPFAAPLPAFAATVEAPAIPDRPAPAKPTTADIKPGEDFNRRGAAQIPDLLRSAGWSQVGDGENWTRPGKTGGISATWNHNGCEALKVFTSNAAPFEAGKAYGPFQILSLLRHGGDFRAAAVDLKGLGYGSQRREISDAWEPPGADGPDEIPPEGGSDVVSPPKKETEDERTLRLLDERVFNPDLMLEPPTPVFMLAGVVISTPGNLTAITAQAKVGKSALVSALIASAITDPEKGRDCLTAQGLNRNGYALLYFDTEQSPYDFQQTVRRTHWRADVDIYDKPDWLIPFGLAGLPIKIMREGLRLKLQQAKEAFGGVYAVILDGVADYVLDVNDPAECNEFVAQLHGWAIAYHCAILCVIHKNPGSEKVRGHLGSQIERKAETNLNLEKDGDVTVVWSAKNRGAPISKDTAPRFAWNDEAKMHLSVSAESAAAAADGNAGEFYSLLAGAVLAPGEVKRWEALVQEVQKNPGRRGVSVSRKTAEMTVAALVKNKDIINNGGNYTLFQ
jgi:hypothetical protein